MDIKDIVFQAVSHLSEGVVITDALLEEPEHPMIIWVNKAMEQITGYTVEEMIGKTPRVLQGKKTDEKERKYLKEELKKGNQFNSVIENYRKDGTTYWVDLLISPVFDQERKIIYYIAIQKDVSHEKEMEQIIDEQLVQLKEASKKLALKRVDLPCVETIPLP